MSDLLNQASLVMVPSGYKEDTVYSVVPTDGSGDLSFTRASNGTRINSAGLVEVCPWNLATDSENFSANYLEINSTISSNTTTAPNGTTTAESLLETTATDVHAIRGDYTQTSGIAYTYSVYAKTISGRNIQVLGSNGFTGPIARVDLSNGTLLSGSTGASVESVGNGWYRISITETTTTTSIRAIIYSMDGTATTFAGSTSNGVYIWGAQVNIGSTAKPYFPTTDRLNVPRLTYQNGGGGCPSLLLEKQSTNGVYPSEDFTNANWQIYGGASVTANTAISPDGTQNADTLDSGTTTALYNPNGVSGGAIPFTASIYVKKVNFEVFRFGMTDDTLEEFSYNYNLDTGAISSASSPMVWTSTSGTITSVGNGWYRLTVTGTKGVSGVARMVVKGQSSSKQYYIWGAQLEASSYATSYIPTTSSSATRVADACFKTGISSLIGQTEGVVFWDIEVETLSATGNENILNLDAGSYGNTIFFIKGSTGILSAEVYVTGVAQCSFSLSLPSVGRYKMALAYANNDFAFYVNGVSRGTDSSGSVPATSRLQLGNGVFGPSDGKTNQCALFKTRLTNAELASITSL